MAWSAARWKTFYSNERAHLGDAGLEEVVRRAPHVDLPPDGALLFPHAHLRGCGHLVAAVARAVIRSGHDRVLALGVLHGGRQQDREVVAAARAGDERVRAVVRGVHGPGALQDRGLADEEFSLDNFDVLLDIAAKVEGRPPPVLVKRLQRSRELTRPCSPEVTHPRRAGALGVVCGRRAAGRAVGTMGGASQAPVLGLPQVVRA